MKKTKLISLLSSCSIVTATVPFFTTSCSKDDSNVAKLSIVKSDVPQLTMVDSIAETRTVNFTCDFFNKDQKPIEDNVR